MTILFSASNRQAAEQFVEAIFAAANPKQSALRAIHGLLDHPWVDDELRRHFVHVTADDLGIEVGIDGE